MTVRFRIFDLWIVHVSPLVFAMLAPAVIYGSVELDLWGWPLVAALVAVALGSVTIVTFGKRGPTIVYKKRIAFVPIQRLAMGKLRITACEDDKVWGDEPDWIEVGDKSDSRFSFMCDKPYDVADWIREQLER